MLFPSELVSLMVTVPSGSTVAMSTWGGGPGNFDFWKLAVQVPAKPPAGMSAALAARERATKKKAKSRKFVFIMLLYHNNKGRVNTPTTRFCSRQLTAFLPLCA